METNCAYSGHSRRIAAGPSDHAYERGRAVRFSGMNELRHELERPETAGNLALILLGLCDYLNSYAGGYVYWDAFSSATLLRAFERGQRVAAGTGGAAFASHGIAGIQQRLAAASGCDCSDCGGSFSLPGSSLLCRPCGFRGCTH